MTNKAIKPELFGQKHSSRDYTKAECWGKNQFNSSFPASLVAYMYSKDVKPIYIKTDRENNILHQAIESEELLGIDPLSDEAYYNYEAGFAPYEKFYQGEREKIDLVMLNHKTNEILSGLEVKLTALPDNTTKDATADMSFDEFYNVIKYFLDGGIIDEKDIIKERRKASREFTANRLITGKAAEEYFEMNYNAIDVFRGYVHPDADENDLRLVFEIKKVGQLFDDYKPIELKIWHTFTDTNLKTIIGL